MVVVAILASLALLTLLVRMQLWTENADPRIDSLLHSSANGSTTLFVYIHGLKRSRQWPLMQEVLEPHGATLQLTYPHPAFSNAEPLTVARRLSDEIERQVGQEPYQHLVLIGQSMGALLAKRAFLDAEQQGLAWAGKVQRLVLVAGMNRGWDISGQKPSDMSRGSWFAIWFGSWLARVGGFGKLILGTETGAPFVANLRMDWIKRMSDPNGRAIEVVQLLGDIDDVVSAEDNNDLRSTANGRFAWLKVRGTGHSSIVDFDDDTKVGPVLLGDYRRHKFSLATVETDFKVLARENEVLPLQPDPDVTHVVFVVHGIRDRGEWAAAFELELQKQFEQLQLRDPSTGLQAVTAPPKLAVASVRYGYFGMGPFLLRPVREKYVRWLMDEYTETLAQYPNAKHVHFVGHSNGTYLLAAGLERYSSLDVGRIVFGGSVVRRDYRWDAVLGEQSVIAGSDSSLRVVNYTALDDWVVALFPRFFEPAFMAPLGNDIGSAGFNGFTTSNPQVQNVPGLRGGHAAFLSRTSQIAKFVLHGTLDTAAPDAEADNPGWSQRVLAMISDWGSRWGTWAVVWPLLAFIIIMVGWHVTTAAAEPRWPFFVAYVALLLTILRNV